MPQQNVIRHSAPRKQTWVQTEREIHLKWGQLTLRKPAAAAIMHQLIALMDRTNAVAISHNTLANLTGVHETTIKRGLKYLRANKWIQQVRLGRRGTVNVYVINSRVAWSDYRDNIRLAVFSAQIIADAVDQIEETLKVGNLQKVPIIHPPEKALPSGEWPEGETGFLDGFEPVVEENKLEDEESS